MNIQHPEVVLLKQKDVDDALNKVATTEEITRAQNTLFENLLTHIEISNTFCYEIPVKDSLEVDHNLDILEHGSVYLTIPISNPDPENNEDYMNRMRVINFYQNDPHSVVKGFKSSEDGILYVYFITTNYRVIIENGRHTDLIFLFNNSEYHDQRLTYLVTTNKNTALKLLKNRNLCISVSNPNFEGSEIILNSNVFKHHVKETECLEACKSINDLFNSVVDSDIPKTDAYSLLPGISQVKLVVTGFTYDFEELFKSIKPVGSDPENNTDLDYLDVVHMIEYDTVNSEINEELADEISEENQEKSEEVEVSEDTI